MAHSHSVNTDLQSFWSVFMRMQKRSTTLRRDTPIPTAINTYFEIGALPLVERRQLDEGNKVHPRAVMTWKGFAVDKLAFKEILVTYVKAAEE